MRRCSDSVDDTLGVIYTHGIAGLCGGLLVGVFANPKVVEYIGVGGASEPARQSRRRSRQLDAAALAGRGRRVGDRVQRRDDVHPAEDRRDLRQPLRLSDEELEIGDHAIHGNEVYPSDVPTLGGPHAPAWQPGGGGAVPAGAGA